MILLCLDKSRTALDNSYPFYIGMQRENSVNTRETIIDAGPRICIILLGLGLKVQRREFQKPRVPAFKRFKICSYFSCKLT